MKAAGKQENVGTISYIAGSSKCKDGAYKELEKMFEKELREKVPNPDKVYFVSGGIKRGENGPQNFVMGMLSKLKGGLHCMSLEEPDFDRWA